MSKRMEQSSERHDMKKPAKPKHPAPVKTKTIRKRRTPQKVTEVYDDCTITIQGDKVWMSGLLAKEIAKAARKAGMTFQEMFIHCIRTYLPQVVAGFQKRAKAMKVKTP